jgi:hypothetical protein
VQLPMRAWAEQKKEAWMRSTFPLKKINTPDHNWESCRSKGQRFSLRALMYAWMRVAVAPLVQMLPASSFSLCINSHVLSATCHVNSFMKTIKKYICQI